MDFLSRISNAFEAFKSRGNDFQHLGDIPNEQSDLFKSQTAQEPKAYLDDPLGLTSAMQYKDRPYSLSYEVLRRMASKNAVVASIITTRVNQVSSFTRPARFDKNGVGFEIRLRDPDEEATDEDNETKVSIEKFLEYTGFEPDNSRDSFDTFIRKLVRDRLTYDQTTFEVVPDRKDRPAEFYAVDAATIRVATERLQESLSQKEKKELKDEEVKYVQVINGEVRAHFTKNELAFGISNPRTDINVSSYGYGELEMLIQQITSHLWAEEYNSAFFSKGGTTKGILNLKGLSTETAQNRQQLESFKRQWIAQVSGMTGPWKTPIVAIPELEYVNVSQTNREMEFEKWMNYLINISSAVFQIDPAEINFPNRGGSGGSGGGGLGDGGIEERLSHSRDKGLRPLLRFIEGLINSHIVSRFDDRFVFAFVGIDTKSDKEIMEMEKQEVETFKTLNELRHEKDMPDVEGGDVVLNQYYLQALQNKQQADMMGGGMMDEGGEFDDGDEFDDEIAENDDESEFDDGDLDSDDVSEEDTEQVEEDEVSKSEGKFIRIMLDE